MSRYSTKTYVMAAALTGAGLYIAFASAACGGGGNSGGATGSTSSATSSVTVTTGTMTTVSASTTTSGTTTASSTSTGGGFPAPPMLGAEIDRMGRPAINTALNHAFDTTAATKGMAKDTYNQDKTESGWAAAYTPEIAKNLAILDAIDGTCGNQIAAGATAVAGRYNTLAGALSDDRLYLDTSTASCTQYLGAELHALGLSATADCGGRKLDYPVMHTTYGILVGGTGAIPPPISDGVAANDATVSSTFPYLAAAH